VRAGNIYLNYNRFGRITRVGGLVIHYNRYNAYWYRSGYINTYNRYYVSRPWHRYYAAPVASYCVVYAQPSRRSYNPVRYSYYEPYTNNYRPNVGYNTSGRNNVSNVNRRQSDRYSKTGKRSKKSKSLAYRQPKVQKPSASSRSVAYSPKKHNNKSTSRKNSLVGTKSIKQTRVDKNRRTTMTQEHPSKQHSVRSKTTRSSSKKRITEPSRKKKSSSNSKRDKQ
jgi:hypothetical protein